MNQKGFTPVLILVIILFVSGLIGGAYYLGKQSNRTTQVTKESVPTKSLPPPTSANTSPVISPTPDPTASWKTYSSDILSFKYPQTLTIEERLKNYIVLLTDSNNPQSVLISIDARLTNNYATYDKAVSSTKAGLTNIQTEEINNGITISGKVGPGYGAGQQVTIVLFRYGNGAIEVETTTADPKQIQVFDQILSTLRFE